MGKTVLDVRGEDFYINGKQVYSEIDGHGKANGTLMNARFIQGIFDDYADRRRFDRFGKIFNADDNTQTLINALPEWYGYGLRAFTVGFQGGWPVFTTDVTTIRNNPFGSDGKQIDKAYAARMDKLIRAADDLNMIVIVNLLYWAQAAYLKDGPSILSAVENASAFLKEGGYTNVIIDVANEFDIGFWKGHPLVQAPECMRLLMEAARRESGGLPVGCSGGGGSLDAMIADASDIFLVHGNGLTRGQYYNFLNRAKGLASGKPVLCNEDSPCISRMDVSTDVHVSWGYYDNFTKQEPPCDWGVTPGQDTFFARRMAKNVGISLPGLPFEEQFQLQGLERNAQWNGKRWIRLAAERPEIINYVNFYRNGEPVYTSYDEPFFLFAENTWIQKEWNIREDDRVWQAEVVLHDGRRVIKENEEGWAENDNKNSK